MGESNRLAAAIHGHGEISVDAIRDVFSTHGSCNGLYGRPSAGVVVDALASV